MAMPTFGVLRSNFPYKSASNGPAGALVKGNNELVQSIGGRLQKVLSAVYADLDAMNACAIRLSYCLNESGNRIGSAPAGVRTYTGKDSLSYIISADEMIKYMKAKLGKPIEIWNGGKPATKQWLGNVKLPTQGILGYDWQGRTQDFGASGHVDLGKLDDASGSPFVTEFGTGHYLLPGPMIVYLWECGK
jgi:hypothetical protein